MYAPLLPKCDRSNLSERPAQSDSIIFWLTTSEVYSSHISTAVQSSIMNDFFAEILVSKTLAVDEKTITILVKIGDDKYDMPQLAGIGPCGS